MNAPSSEQRADWFWYCASDNMIYPADTPRRPGWLRRSFMRIVFGVVAVYD